MVEIRVVNGGAVRTAFVKVTQENDIIKLQFLTPQLFLEGDTIEHDQRRRLCYPVIE